MKVKLLDDYGNDLLDESGCVQYKTKRISPLVEIRKVDNGMWNVYKAYFRGTDNRVCQANGEIVPARTKIADLKFDLLNNPMERGALCYSGKT